MYSDKDLYASRRPYGRMRRSNGRGSVDKSAVTKAVSAVSSELADLDDMDRNNLHVNNVRAMLERILAEITT